MGALRPTHILILLLIVLLLFGAQRLPDLAKSIGQSLKILRTDVKELQEDDAPARPPAQGRPALDGHGPGPVDGDRSGGGSPRPAVASSPDAPA